jgi:hypothetical protein
MLSSQEFTYFKKEVEKALLELAMKLNVNIKAGKIKYTSNSFNLDMQVTKIDVNGKSFECAEFEKHCVWYGLQPEDFNKSFWHRGKKYTICGLKPKNRKLPILAKSEEGTVYKFPEDVVKTSLKTVS